MVLMIPNPGNYELTGVLPTIVVTAPRYADPVVQNMPGLAHAEPISKLLLIADSEPNAGINPARLKTGGNYHLGVKDTVRNDVTITGGNAVIEGYVEADLAVMGGTVDISGTVTGDVAVMGGNMVNAGRVLGDAAIFGGTAVNRGEIKGDIVMFGGAVTLDSASYIGGDVAVIGGTVARDSHAVVIGKVESVKISGLDELGPRLSRVLRLPRAVARGSAIVGRFVFLMIMGVVYLLHLLIMLILPSLIAKISERIKICPKVG